MTRCIERQLANPIPIPTTWAAGLQKMCDSEAKPTAVPYFRSKELQSWQWKRPISMRRKGKKQPSNNVCRNSIPQVDTPLSPPVTDRGPDYGASVRSCSYSDETVTVDSISNHFRRMSVSEASTLKSIPQIQSQVVNYYLSKTTVPGETLAERETKERAFLDGRSALTFLLMPGGVSQYWYSISYGLHNTLPRTIPLD